MRFLLPLSLLLPAVLAAQQPEAGLRYERPTFATGGKETMPQMLIDEQILSAERFARIPFPMQQWTQEMACLMEHGLPVDKVGTPPDIIVIPGARTIKVNDLTADSMAYAEDSTFMGEAWSPVTIAYALIKSNVIVMVSEWRANPYVLRHEALHFMLWREGLAHLGHPPEFFNACDRDYDPR